MKKISWDEYNLALLRGAGKLVKEENEGEEGKIDFKRFQLRPTSPVNFKSSADEVKGGKPFSLFIDKHGDRATITFYPKKKIEDTSNIKAGDLEGASVIIGLRPDLLANKKKWLFWVKIPALKNIKSKGKEYFPANEKELAKLIEIWTDFVKTEDLYANLEETRPDIMKEFIAFHKKEFPKYINEIKKNKAVEEVTVSGSETEDMGSFRTLDVKLKNGDSRKVIIGLVSDFSYEVLKKGDKRKYEKTGRDLTELNNYLVELNKKDLKNNFLL